MAGCEHSTKRFISMKDPAENSKVFKPKLEDEGDHRTQLLEPGTRTRRTAVQMCVKLRNPLVAGGQLSAAVSLTVRGETNITSRKWGTECG